MDKDEQTLDLEWTSVDGEGLVRVVPVDSFRSGCLLVARLADIAEKQNHDPSIELTSRKVVITLYSHDVQDVTERDIAFASAVDALFD